MNAEFGSLDFKINTHLISPSNVNTEKNFSRKTKGKTGPYSNFTDFSEATPEMSLAKW